MTDADQAFAAALEHHQAGRLAEAERRYRRILEQVPDHADSLHLLGVLAFQTGNLEPALALIERSIALRPDGAVYRNNLGQVLERLGRFDEAAGAYEAAISLDSGYAEAFNNLGHLLEREGDLGRAEDCYRKAISLDARYAEPHTNLGNLLKDCGELDAAIESYRRAIALRPDVSFLHSNLLLTLHYHAASTPESLAREHAVWAERHVAPLAAKRRLHTSDRAPERRLRIGYISPDYREHPVARFVLPIFREHDREQFEVFAYSDTPRTDDVSELIEREVDVWRDVAAFDDETLAEQIRLDRIDLLVDLAAHSGRNRLLVFARKPAPVQLTYLAYCSTTGVDQIDYRLTDRFLDPDDTDLSHYVEQSIRLPGCYWCYSAPPASSLPSTDRLPGPPTFGCLNNFAKVTDSTLELWMQLLEQAPEASMLLYARGERHRARVQGFLRRAGIDTARVSLIGRQSLEDYLETYKRIDVCLDPVPFGGGTTTCDSLFMGVPVVTLAGSTAVSRAGSTLLTNAGLPEFIARSEPEYVTLAAEALNDAANLTRLRRVLRSQLESSPVMDVEGFVSGLEAAFRDAWRRWCNAKPG